MPDCGYPFTNVIGKVSCRDNAVWLCDHGYYIRYCTVWADDTALYNLSKLLDEAGFWDTTSCHLNGTAPVNSYSRNIYHGNLTIIYKE